MLDSKILGIQGETAVCDYLKQHGFTILQRNYQTRRGEVDIIATKQEYVVFVEVKTRRVKYIPLSQAVTLLKQKRIIRAAQHFIATNHFRDKVFRFDVATVLITEQQPIIEYFANAFMAT